MECIVTLIAPRDRLLASVLVALFLVSTALAQETSHGGQPSLDATQIVSQLVRQNQNRAALLKHYQGCRYYSLHYTGFPFQQSADMAVTVEYDAPDHKQFRIVREDGSRLLLNRVLKQLLDNEKQALDEQNRSRTALTPDNYEFQLMGADTVSGRPQYVLQVTPRSNNKFLYRGRIWVDAADFAVSRISAQPARNPSFWISHTEIEHEYKKLGDFWLPAHNTSVTKVRFGGSATLHIEYLDYHIGDSQKSSIAATCAAVPGEVQVSQRR